MLMRDSIPPEKNSKREIIEQQIKVYLDNGGKIHKFNAQEFSNHKPKQFDWSGRELTKDSARRKKHELSKKV